MSDISIGKILSEMSAIGPYNSIGKTDLKIGTVFFVTNDKDRKIGDFHQFLNQLVSIDGKEYKIKGVERHPMPVIYKGETIGILVY